MIKLCQYISKKLRYWCDVLKAYFLYRKYKGHFKSAITKEVAGEKYICLPYDSCLYDIVVSIYGQSHNTPLRYNLKSHPSKPPKLSKNASTYEESLYRELLCYYRFKDAPFADRLIAKVPNGGEVNLFRHCLKLTRTRI